MKIKTLGLSVPGKTSQTLETSDLVLNCDGLLATSSTGTTLYSYAAALNGTKSNIR